MISTARQTEQVDNAQPGLVRDIEALVAAIMVDAPLAELIAITDRIAAAVDHWDEIPAAAITELRSAIDLIGAERRAPRSARCSPPARSSPRHRADLTVSMTARWILDKQPPPLRSPVPQGHVVAAVKK